MISIRNILNRASRLAGRGASGPRHSRIRNYSLLSLIIKFNKTILVSLFVSLSAFLFIYCSSSHPGLLKESAHDDLSLEIKEALDKDDESREEAVEAEDNRGDGNEEMMQEESYQTPDLRKVISILNLAYSGERLQGVFWGETDFASTVYLSFDDGPNMTVVETDEGLKTICDTILDTLMKRDLKAVFFINGRNLEYGSPEEEYELKRVLLRMMNEGHIIGNHSYSHHNLARGPYADGQDDRQDIAREFILTQESLNRLLGFVYPLVLVRPPYAEPGRTQDLDEWLISEKQYLISLQFDSYDYAYKEDGLWNSVSLLERMNTLLTEQGNGGVLLLHELESTAMLLPRILDEVILERGYRVEGMETLLEKKYGRKS